jgi:hypothetical protein
MAARKPFAVVYRGVDGTTTRKFATLTEVQAHVKKLWQGAEYIGGYGTWGIFDFHTDYAGYQLRGCSLSDLGERVGPVGTDGYWEWVWKELG